MQNDLVVIRDRVRAALASRQICGLFAIAAGLRIERLIALADRGHIQREDAHRQALEAEAVAHCFKRLRWP